MFYSDDLAKVPVRAITRVGDNKSDPNIETGTFGLFSTCERSMRSGVVANEREHIVFATQWRGQRAIAGFYRIGWYAEGTSHGSKSDYSLAAEDAHFVANPISLKDADAQLGSNLSRPFRLVKLLNPKVLKSVIRLIRSQPNALDLYNEEVERLERFNQFHGGFRYPTWQQKVPFSWEVAGQYLAAAGAGKERASTKNSVASNAWKCASCGMVTKNKALLRRCPQCGKFGTLVGDS
jgi:hypothetical protein